MGILICFVLNIFGCLVVFFNYDGLLLQEYFVQKRFQ